MSREQNRSVQHDSATAPSPRDLPAFLPYACVQMQALFRLRVHCVLRDDLVSKLEKYAKKTTVRSRLTLLPTVAPSRITPPDGSRHSRGFRSRAASDVDDDDSLHVTVVHDAPGRVLELALRSARVPHLLLQLAVLAAPYHPHLTRLTLSACTLDARALHQLMLLSSRLTEIFLDDTPLRIGGHHLLLEPPSNLRWLSLARCALGDEGAVALAAALRHPLPASRTLRILCLSTNDIGDEGASALGEALRSNRALQYLSLCDNRITDAGAAVIFRSLAEFALTGEESTEGRRRLVERLRVRHEVYTRIYTDLMEAAMRKNAAMSAAARAGDAGRKKAKRTDPSASAPAPGGSAAIATEALAAKALAMTEEALGPPADPFDAGELRARGGAVYCSGNTALCALDLAHNALSRASLVRLLGVLSWQHRAPAADARAGLVHVLLEGNPLPSPCVELDMLALRLAAWLGRSSTIDQSSRPSKKVDRIPKPRK